MKKLAAKPISRRNFIKGTLAGVGAMACSVNNFFLSSCASEGNSNKHPGTPGDPPPNLVYVFPDEMRQHAAGCYGADPVLTPNLNQLAAEGLMLTNAVSNRPVCSPYRAMMMTGMFPHSNGVFENCVSVRANHLNENDRCLSNVLSDAGYSQGYIGKYHLDTPNPDNYPYTEGIRPGSGLAFDAYTPPGPRRHGFDFWHSHGCCDKHLDPHYWVNDAAVDQRIDPGEYSVKHETDVAVDYIHNTGGAYRTPGQPFSLFVSYNPPHMPFNQVPSEYLDLYDGLEYQDLLNRPNVDLSDSGSTWALNVKRYFAAVSATDEQFGRILLALETDGLADNTIVIFTSDHGELMGSHDLMYKTYWYDESLLVPFIIRWPGKITQGTDDLLFNTPDIMPTVLGLMGLDSMIPSQVEGTDRSGILLGTDSDRPSSALYMKVAEGAPSQGWRGLKTHQYTYVSDASNIENHLYDNLADPYQQNDIYGSSPGIVATLDEELREWLSRNNDPWTG